MVFLSYIKNLRMHETDHTYLGILMSMKTMALESSTLKCIGTKMCCADTLSFRASFQLSPNYRKQYMLKESITKKHTEPKITMTTLYNAWYEEIFLHLDDLNAIFSSIHNQQVNSFPSSFSFFCFRLYFNREVKVLVTQSCPTLWPHGSWPARLLCPWNSPGKNTGVGCHYLLQRVFLTQRLKPIPWLSEPPGKDR